MRRRTALGLIVSALLCCIAPQQYSQATIINSYRFGVASTLNNGLVGYWKFDEGTGTSTEDSSVNSNTGTLIGGATWDTGHTGLDFTNPYALSLDGTDNYVDAGSDASLNVTSAFSVSQWIRPASTAGNHTFSHKGHYAGGPNSGWTARISGNLIKFFLESTGEVLVQSSANSIPTNDIWYHIVLWHDGANGKIYINGTENGSAAGTVASHASYPYEIGHNSHIGNQHYFSGLIDDMRIYNRALTQTEITALANGEN